MKKKMSARNGMMTFRKRVIFKATDNFDKFTFMAMKIIVKLAAEVFKHILRAYARLDCSFTGTLHKSLLHETNWHFFCSLAP